MSAISDEQIMPGPAVDPLTVAEARVLQLLVRGWSNKGIGNHLFISANTVKFHVKNILQKLGVKNRSEAVWVAVSAGLIDEVRVVPVKAADSEVIA